MNGKRCEELFGEFRNGPGGEVVCGEPATHVLDRGRDNESYLCTECAQKAHYTRVESLKDIAFHNKVWGCEAYAYRREDA